MRRTSGTLNLRNIEQFGISLLTGEACKLGFRVLCDVSEEGKETIERFLSCKIVFNENWNSRVGDKPATGSILLTRSTLCDLLRWIACTVLNVYAYIDQDGELIILEKDSDWLTVDEATGKMRIQEDYLVDFYKKLHINPLYNDKTGDRNVHAFTGRTV